MRCKFCDGSGLNKTAGRPQPCKECGGCGVAHCCDGLQACCEIEPDLVQDEPNRESGHDGTQLSFRL